MRSCANDRIRKNYIHGPASKIICSLGPFTTRIANSAEMAHLGWWRSGLKTSTCIYSRANPYTNRRLHYICYTDGCNLKQPQLSCRGVRHTGEQCLPRCALNMWSRYRSSLKRPVWHGVHSTITKTGVSWCGWKTRSVHFVARLIAVRWNSQDN